MAKFDRYAPKLSIWEGGFANNPADKGGPTNKGVTLTTFRRFFGNWNTVDDLRRMTEEQWRKVMRSYWDRCCADDIRNQSIAEMLVDWHINAGTAGIKTWQRSVGLAADGIVGPQSLAVLNAPDAEQTFAHIKRVREGYYQQIVQRNPSQIIFLKGWLNRVNSFDFEEGA